MFRISPVITKAKIRQMLESGWQGWVVSGSAYICQGVVRRPFDHSGTWVKVCLFLIWHIHSRLKLDMYMSRLNVTAHMSARGNMWLL